MDALQVKNPAAYDLFAVCFNKYIYVYNYTYIYVYIHIYICIYLCMYNIYMYIYDMYMYISIPFNSIHLHRQMDTQCSTYSTAAAGRPQNIGVLPLKW